MSYNYIKTLIYGISSELNITVKFIGDTLEECVDCLNIDCSWAIGSNEIIIGKYLNDENMLISFFHEIGHILIAKEYMEKWRYNTLMIELECWNIGIEEARDRGVLFSDNAIRFGLEKVLTYCGHDERECTNWYDTYGKNLIINIG